MRLERIQYLDWARRQFDESPPRYNLASSGMAWASAAEAGIDLASLPIAGTDSFGHPGLRGAVADRYGVGRERVLLATGTTLANFLVQAALVKAGDTVLCEWPAYEPLWRSLESLDARVVYFKRDEAHGFAPDLAAIAAGFAQGARLCVLSDLHNPSATLLGREVVREIGRLAQRYDGWVLVDEVYLASVFDADIESAAHLGERLIATSSLTKTHGLAGLRAGWAIAPPAVVDRGNDIFAYLGGNAPFIANAAAAQAFSRLDALRARAQGRRAENWPLVRKFADARGMLVTEPAGAFIVWLKLPVGLRADSFVDHALKKHETLVVPGTFFGVDDHIRLGYSSSRSTVEEGLRRLGAALDEMSPTA